MEISINRIGKEKNMKNPKEKGNNHERKVAKMLSDWSGEKFMRTPMSGAIHNFKDKRVVSDIVAPLSIGDWPFSIEAKCVECSWEFNTFIEGTSMTLKEHWKQCCDDAEREGLIPMLVFTKNYRDIFIMITKEVFYQLDIEPESYINLIHKGQDLVILKFSDFLQLVSVDTLISKNLLCE